MKSISEIFSDNLALYMKEYGFNQVDIARELGVSPTAVRGWLKYGSFPRPDQIEKLCNLFNCSATKMLTPQTEKSIHYDEITKRVIDEVELLNDEGKEKVLSYTKDLSERYRR